MDTARGFTLIELLVVIGLIGVISSVVLVAINPLTQFARARDAQRKNDLSNYQKAVELFYNDKDRYPTLAELGSIAPNYIQTIPQDPIAPAAQYQYVPEAVASPQLYRLYAALERCQGSGPNACFDKQACNSGNGGVCPNAGSANCGSGKICSYGVSSPNTTP